MLKSHAYEGSFGKKDTFLLKAFYYLIIVSVILEEPLLNLCFNARYPLPLYGGACQHPDL